MTENHNLASVVEEGMLWTLQARSPTPATEASASERIFLLLLLPV